jgi:hypothetical protein
MKVHDKNKTRILATTLVLGYIVFASFVFVKFVQKIDTFHPEAVKSAGVVLSYSHIVPQGGSINIKRKPAQHTKGCTVYTQRFLAPTGNPSLEILTSEELVTFDKDVDYVEFNFTIPNSIAPGDYIYRSQVNYYCNWYERLFGPVEYSNKPVIIKITPK